MQRKSKKAGVIAQLVEQRTENPCVPGSIPGDTTKVADFMKLATFEFLSDFEKLMIYFENILSLKVLIFVLILLAILSSCQLKSSDIDDFDQISYKPSHALGFTIVGAEGNASTIININNPWQGADSVQTQLFISRNGEEAPKGFRGQILEGDAKKVVVMSSTHIAMLDAIGEVGAVVGVSGIDYITNGAIQKSRDSIGDVGHEGNVNYELIASLDPDIVLLYAVSGASSMEGKLNELGIPYMYVGDYLEESPLGKAEWLVALSEVLGKRDKGEEIFAQIPVRYNAIKDMVANASAYTPKVMFNTPYGDSWVMPSNLSYSVQLINDAGGKLVYDKNTGNTSLPIDMEVAYLLTEESDYWLNVGMARSLDDVARMCPKFTNTNVFKEGRVYNNNRRTNAAGGNDYYESAIVNPDLVLLDLVKIFHPELLPDSTEFTYYKRLK